MLALPLHCYDEAGRIKPPLWFYWGLVIAVADWLVLVFALTMRAQTERILAIIYPVKAAFGVSLLVTIPFIIVLILLSQRERLWKQSWTRWRLMLIPITLLGLAANVMIFAWQIVEVHGRFELVPALRLLYLIAGAWIVLKSKHLRLMIADWKQPDH